MLPACGGWGKNQKRDLNGRAVERDVVGNIADNSGREPHIGNEIGAAVRNGQSSAQRRADLGFARFDGFENAVHDGLVGVADGQMYEFAQKAGFGVAAERNAHALR